jgi:peptidoglycan/LPS O-acetylase OafA/YrhL
VEEAFYLVFPLVLQWVRRYQTLFLGLLMTCIVLGPISRTHGNAVWREYSYLGGMDAIALGCLTAMFGSRIHLRARVLVALGAGLLIFTLCFSLTANKLDGFSMTVLAIGACLIIAASARTMWTAPRILRPLLDLGQRSYEVYLTHMFIVFAFLEVFLRTGKQMKMVPVFFIGTIVVSGVAGDVARMYSEPMNRLLRSQTFASKRNTSGMVNT